MRTIVASTIFVLLLGLQPAVCANELAGVRIFAQVEIDEMENEYNGLQVFLIDDHGKVQVLWRSASGEFEKPLLLQATQDGRVFSVVVPTENQMDGKWTLSLDGNYLNATGPRGLHFRLREIKAR